MSVPSYDKSSQQTPPPVSATNTESQQQQQAGRGSASSSWFAKAKSMAAVAATVTSQVVTAGVEQSKKTIAEMKAPPSTIQCSGCPLQVEVPQNLFDWVCEKGHNNDRTKTTCATCHLAKSKLFRTVTCDVCKSVTPVPETNAEKAFKSSVESTKKFVANAAQQTKEGINYLKSAPDTFHCAHCNSLLAVPTGPWMCQTCTAENVEEAKLCKQCTQKKTEQKAICGVCRQSTQIPATNFTDSLVATMRDISQSGRKIYYDVANKPYVTCPRCNFHVPVPPKPIAQNNNNNNAVQPQLEVEGQSAPPPQPDNAPIGSLVGVICPSCKNSIEQ